MWESDKTSFTNKIGYITNNSSSLYASLANYKLEDEEYKVIQKRIKILTSFQSQSIDAAKGIKVMEFPEWWNKFQKTDDENERERVDFQNKIMSNKRPYFFKWLYDHYNRDYIKYSENYNDFCKSNFGITLNEFLDKKEKSKEEEKTEFYYQKYDKLINSQSVMNKICRVMETEVSLLKENKLNVVHGFDVDENKLPDMKKLYLKWKNSRKNYDKENEDVLGFEIRTLADKISSKSNEIARLAVNTSMGFAISVFPDYVVDMYSSETVKVPVLDDAGDIVFGGEIFSIMELILNG